MKWFILPVALLVFASCEKKQCYVCTTVHTKTISGAYNSEKTDTSRVTACDMTKKDADKYSRDHTRFESGDIYGTHVFDQYRAYCE